MLDAKSAMNTAELKAKAFGERFADEVLVDCATRKMSDRLYRARVCKKHGWWNKDVCTIEQLYVMRDKAISDSDHVSVLNFTAMIMLRESEQPIRGAHLQQIGKE